MSILIRPPNKVNKKKKQSKTAKEILQRLQDFLNAESKEPAEILYSFWGDQQNAITYKELRELVQNGDLTQEQWQEWQQDYSKLVASKLDQMWQKAMEAGISGQPIFDNFESFELDMKSPGVVSWIKERGAAFVTASTDEQKKAIQSLLAKKVVEKYTVDELARIIRPCIGLTKQDSEAVMRQYDTLKKNLREQHPRMKAESIQRKALDAAQKYAERKHRQRAMTIAQTELAFAYNRGADQGVRQAQEQGLLGKTIKRWITSGDDSVCSTCEALDGTEIEMDDNFNFGGRLLFVGHKMLPPAHPRCGCAVEYIEVEPPTFEPSIGTTDEEESPEEQPVEFSSGDEAMEYFGQRPDRALRRENPEEYQRLRDEYDKSQYKTWHDALEGTESRAVMNYAGPDYSSINGLLRHEMTENQVNLWNATCDMTVQDMVSDITSAIDKFELKAPIKVYRTCETDVLESLQTKVGSIFHDNGFGSTTAIREKKASGNIFMEITVPSGKGHGAWIAPIGQEDEYEFLLQRGTNYVVTDVGQDGADTIIKLTVTGHTKTDWTFATKEEVIEQWKRKGFYDEESAKLL